MPPLYTNMNKQASRIREVKKKTIYRSNSMNIIHDPLCAGTNFFSLPSIKPDDKINEKYWCAAVV